MNEILKFYSRKDIQKEIANFAKNREVGVRFKESFGKRPEIIQFSSDVGEFAKQGATSFHVSVERWKDPLNLSSGLSRKQLDDLRSAWDLIIDIDSKFIEYNKKAALLLVNALQFNGLKNIGCKFSGGTGIHLFIPFESFPKKVNNIETRLLFPEAAQAIATYLKKLIEPHLRDQILSLNSVKEISKNLSIPLDKLTEKNQFNPYSILEIDSQLITSRHMIRAPYSINEKTNLVSIPIQPNEINQFTPKTAKMQNVEVKNLFFNPEKSEQEEAKQLLMQALDFESKQKKPQNEKREQYNIPEEEVSEKLFPECITKLLEGVKSDGRKRAVFILVSFLQHMGWSYEKIQTALLEWNKKNYEPLRDGYILSQVNWFKRQPNKILPPNCDHESYYKTMGVKCSFCKYKNPVNYVKVKREQLQYGKKKSKR